MKSVVISLYFQDTRVRMSVLFVVRDIGVTKTTIKTLASHFFYPLETKKYEAVSLSKRYSLAI